MAIKHFNLHPIRIKNTVRGEYEEQVQNGLAVTPRDMLELTNRGIPITPSNAGEIYDEGVSNLDFEPPMEFHRGVDIADMWEHRERMKKNVRSPEFTKLFKGEEVVE